MSIVSRDDDQRIIIFYIQKNSSSFNVSKSISKTCRHVAQEGRQGQACVTCRVSTQALPGVQSQAQGTKSGMSACSRQSVVVELLDKLQFQSI